MGQFLTAEPVERTRKSKPGPAATSRRPRRSRSHPSSPCPPNAPNPLSLRRPLQLLAAPAEEAATRLPCPAVDGCNALSFEPTIEARPTTNLLTPLRPRLRGLKVPQNRRPPKASAPQRLARKPSSSCRQRSLSPSSAPASAPAPPPRRSSRPHPVGARPGPTQNNHPAARRLRSSSAPSVTPAAAAGSIEPLPGRVGFSTWPPPPKPLRLPPRRLHRPRRPGPHYRRPVPDRPGERPDHRQLPRKPPDPLRRIQVPLLRRRPRRPAHPGRLRQLRSPLDPDPLLGPRIGAAGRTNHVQTTVGPTGGARPTRASQGSQRPSLHRRHRNPPGRHLLALLAEARPRRRLPGNQGHRHHPAQGPGRQAGRHPLLPRRRPGPSRPQERPGGAEQASPSCPAASEVGSVDVGAGAGPTPLNVSGHAYLAGPYKGAPLSLAIITPAVAGPFDLGTVVVSTALYVNPETAQIHAVSDPIPTILEGIPLDVRSITLKMSRPNFTLNPTDCEPLASGSADSIFNSASTIDAIVSK